MFINIFLVSVSFVLVGVGLALAFVKLGVELPWARRKRSCVVTGWLVGLLAVRLVSSAW